MARSPDSSTPRLTIGLPVYNGASFLASTLASILGQTFEDLELIISDNGSTDGTGAICRRHALADRRVRLVSQSVNRGAAWNYNHVFALARGAYFKWAAHDDLLAPAYCAQLVAVLDRFPEVVLAYPQTAIIDDQGRYVERYAADHLHLLQDSPAQRFDAFLRARRGPLMLSPVFGVMRASALRRTRLIEPYPASDQTLVGELTLQGKFYELGEELFHYRAHAGTSVRAHRSGEAVAAWFDPALLGRPACPHWRAVGRYVRAIATTRMGGTERWRCAWALTQWVAGCSQELARETLRVLVWPALRPSPSARGKAGW